MSAFAAYLQANAAALGLAPADVTAIVTAAAAFKTAQAAWDAMQAQINTALTLKDDTRAAAEALIRPVAQMLQNKTSVTDDQRTAMGLPIYKTTRTAVGAIETRPVLYKVDNEHLLQRLWFSDESTPGSKAKPKGAGLCEIREQIGGTAPTDPETMPLLALESKTPHRNDLEAADVGKLVYYALRWVNTAGDPGPWSLITSYMVN
jgi:hypothetical protein